MHSQGNSPSQDAKHFLHLLDDVYRIHGFYLEEIASLQARVRELEIRNAALSGGSVPTLPDIHGCAVYLVSMEGLIQGWSQGAGELYGYAAEEVIGKTESMLAPVPPLEPACPGIATRRSKGGSLFQVSLHCAVLRNEEGHPKGRMRVEVPVQHRNAQAEVGQPGTLPSGEDTP